MVQKDSRREGKLALAVLARMHAKYVMQITSNPKIFDQRYYHAITVDLIRTSKDIYRSIWAANNALVKSKGDYAARRKYQIRAVMLCNMMLADIEIAQSVFHLKGKRMRYWAGTIIEIRNNANNAYRCAPDCLSQAGYDFRIAGDPGKNEQQGAECLGREP